MKFKKREGIDPISNPSSAAFFAEERESLEAKREKVRILQRGGALPAEQLHDLPQQIPALLPVGTRVTCKLDKWRHPSDVHMMAISDNLLCQGTVEVVVKEHNGYKIRFDSARLGNGEALFVPDQCVMSNGPVPLLTVDKPDFEEGVETNKDNMFLIDSIAELQGQCQLQG